MPAARVSGTMIWVTVPEGVGSGDAFWIEAGRQFFSVTVPEGKQAGDEILVDADVTEQSTCIASSTHERSDERVFEVIVPDGAKVGDDILVEADGSQVTVTVPEGCGPGSALSVMLPAAWLWAPTEPVPRPASDTSQESRSKVQALGQAPGTQPQLQLQSQPRRQSQPASDASVFIASYRIGRRLQVMRTDGSFSKALVVDFDERCGLYRVELLTDSGKQTGLFKEGVSEEDMYSRFL